MIEWLLRYLMCVCFQEFYKELNKIKPTEEKSADKSAKVFGVLDRFVSKKK